MYDTTIIDELMIKGPLWRLYKFYGRKYLNIKIGWHTKYRVEIRLVFLVWDSIPFWWNALNWEKKVKYGTYRYPIPEHQRDTARIRPPVDRSLHVMTRGALAGAQDWIFAKI